jgi:hypothetical protein
VHQKQEGALNDQSQSNEDDIDWRLKIECRVPVPEAARMKGISVDTFKRHYSHLIERASPGRQVVKIKNVID